METVFAGLNGFSQSIISLVSATTTGVVAVKAAPYRVVSGVALTNDLVAVTNYSLRRSDRVPVHTADSSEGIGSILGRVPGVDVAILKIEGARLQPLPASDPATAKVGMMMAVVGLTIDVGPSASFGILGAVGGPRRTWRGGSGATLDRFLRLDVNLYPSQSGAAVVDSQGRLIGMATPSLSRHSAVAIPVSTLQRLGQELLTRGHIRQGYLGLGLQPVSLPPALRQKANAASSFAAFSEVGLMVVSVEPGSPAENSNFQLGDILVLLDNRLLNDTAEMQAVLGGENIGRTVPIVFLRGGEALEAQITIAERIKKAN